MWHFQYIKTPKIKLQSLVLPDPIFNQQVQLSYFEDIEHNKKFYPFQLLLTFTALIHTCNGAGINRKFLSIISTKKVDFLSIELNYREIVICLYIEAYVFQHLDSRIQWCLCAHVVGTFELFLINMFLQKSDVAKAQSWFLDFEKLLLEKTLKRSCNNIQTASTSRACFQKKLCCIFRKVGKLGNFFARTVFITIFGQFFFFKWRLLYPILFAKVLFFVFGKVQDLRQNFSGSWTLDSFLAFVK